MMYMNSSFKSADDDAEAHELRKRSRRARVAVATAAVVALRVPPSGRSPTDAGAGGSLGTWPLGSARRTFLCP